MLTRSFLPLARLRPSPHISRIAASQSRNYAQRRRDGRSPAERRQDFYLGKQKDYKLPSAAAKPTWQQAASASGSSKQPLRRVPGNDDDLKIDDADAFEARTRPHPARESATLENDSPFPKEEFAPQKPRPHSEEPIEPEPTETDAYDRTPLPDLTKGIPSTLDAELREAQSRDSHSRRSLNITEDPSEYVGEAEGPVDRVPREEYVSSSDKKKNAAVKYTYLILALAFTGYAAYLGRNWESEEEEKSHVEAPSGWGPGLFYNRIKARMTSQVSYYSDPVTTKLLPDEEKDPAFRMPLTLVLSLEDLLVHQEWTRDKGWRIAKRPGLDYFLRYLSQYYELVLFTSQPSAMGDQVMRKLDPYMMVRWPLYREATLYKDGGYIKVCEPRIGLTLLTLARIFLI